MKRLTKAFLSGFLALAFVSRGAAALCPPKALEHGCCDKPAPAAPQTPCPEMACCQILPAAAAPASSTVQDLVVLIPYAPRFAETSERSSVVSIRTDGSPPGPAVSSSCSRAPPALLG
jgi:hypothetical protein